MASQLPIGSSRVLEMLYLFGLGAWPREDFLLPEREMFLGGGGGGRGICLEEQRICNDC